MSLELLPGSVIGILGDRSSSHYLIQTAHNLGYTVATYTDKPEPITPSEADYQFHGADEWATFVGISSVMTYANTWLTLEMIQKIADLSLPQGINLLEMTDDHAISRAFLEASSVNILPYALATSLEEISINAHQLGYPVVVKPIFKHGPHSSRVILRGEYDLGLVAPLIDGGTILVESWLDDVTELIVTAVRDAQGEVVIYPINYRKSVDQLAPVLWSSTDQLSADVVEAVNDTVAQIGQNIASVGAYTVAFLYSDTGNLYVRDVLAGLDDNTVLYSTTANISVYENHLRALVGQALAPVREVQQAILLPFNSAQIDKIQKHWHIKPEWRVFYHPGNQSGYVVSSGRSMDELWNQLLIAGVWDISTLQP